MYSRQTRHPPPDRTNQNGSEATGIEQRLQAAQSHGDGGSRCKWKVSAKNDLSDIGQGQQRTDRRFTERQRGEDEALRAIAIMEQGKVVDLDRATALEAARLSI